MPIILHIPHSATAVPDDIRSELMLSDLELEGEITALTDWYTDELFSLPGAERIISPISRVVCDMERFAEDELEPTSKLGFGVIYTSRVNGSQLRKPPSALKRKALLERFYYPHHEALQLAVESGLRLNKYVTIIDCHSFPDHALPFQQQAGCYPDICIGTSGIHSPIELVESTVDAFERQGYTVKVDTPFSGSMVPMAYYGKERRVRSLMIEVNRRLYLVDGNHRSDRFEKVRTDIQEVLLSLGA